MMSRIIIFLFCVVLTAARAQGQTLIPFEFTSEEDNRFVKENDSCRCYVSSGDSSMTVCLNEENLFYKLVNHAQKTVAEGSYILEGEKYLQTGKWIEKYDNGRPKIVGCYRRNKPIGTWQEFYANGKVKTIYNYTIMVNEKGSTSFCLSGTWQEFYPDGKVKVNGYYLASETKVTDTLIVEDPITEQKVMKLTARTECKPVKTGTWEYYNENGELDKKDEF